jgi:hypothetical protein
MSLVRYVHWYPWPGDTATLTYPPGAPAITALAPSRVFGARARSPFCACPPNARRFGEGARARSPFPNIQMRSARMLNGNIWN